MIDVAQRVLEILLYLEANHRSREGSLSLKIVFNNILLDAFVQRKDILESLVFEVAELKINEDLKAAKRLIGIISTID